MYADIVSPVWFSHPLSMCQEICVICRFARSQDPVEVLAGQLPRNLQRYHRLFVHGTLAGKKEKDRVGVKIGVPRNDGWRPFEPSSMDI